ncbi:hypothetical protein VTJ83DRAFT_5276 [Remersonia thermophila]|uniref:Uncharacterized protein n=1 Tax=Remersonia thermophila TaxID=72144 RepID=A0ABR4D7A9_9PEZI
MIASGPSNGPAALRRLECHTAVVASRFFDEYLHLPLGPTWLGPELSDISIRSLLIHGLAFPMSDVMD